jgi:outer membrane protein OmpA-like peptidoglycan-associated protein
MKNTNDDDLWISTADLMSGLMVIFLFIAISMLSAQNKLVTTYQEGRGKINASLEELFNAHKGEYGITYNPEEMTATLPEDMAFKAGSADLTPECQERLDKFMPTFIKILYDNRETIKEVNIEGHTSSEWYGAQTQDESYFNNMALSQSRTRGILRYVLENGNLADYKEWMKTTIKANGLSFSNLKYKDGKEDAYASRRVEFKIVTSSEKVIKDIQNLGKK